MTILSEIEGIGAADVERLSAAGISTVETLLNAGGTALGRAELAGKTGIRHDLILEWITHADLFRIDGIGREYADLLGAAGVDSIPELAQRNPANLTAAMARFNEEKKLVRSLPGLQQVESWIEQATNIEKAVSH